jgi:hypothetical protein
MGTGIPTPLSSYTEVEQKEMLAADSDSEWNVVKTNPRRSFHGRISGVDRYVWKRKGTNKTDRKENKDPILGLKAKLLCLRRNWTLLTPPTRLVKRTRDEAQTGRQCQRLCFCCSSHGYGRQSREVI